MITCKRCGTNFERKSVTGLPPTFCSYECSKKWHGEERAIQKGQIYAPAGDRQCLRCGNKFFTQRGGTVKYCAECRPIVNLDRARDANERRKAIGAVTHVAKARLCLWCHVSFVPQWENRDKQHYCSSTCNRRGNAEHKKVGRRKRNNEGGCPDHRARRSLRRMYGHVPEGAFEHVDPLVVFERDHWTCAICGKRIDAQAKFPDVMSASVDHVVPLSKGGAHLYANVRATHYECNRRKGAHG